jgi:hypothetical protein
MTSACEQVVEDAVRISYVQCSVVYSAVSNAITTYLRGELSTGTGGRSGFQHIGLGRVLVCTAENHGIQ